MAANMLRVRNFGAFRAGLLLAYMKINGCDVWHINQHTAGNADFKTCWPYLNTDFYVFYALVRTFK